MEPEQNELAFRFLLGKLTDEEQMAVEKEYFHNTDIFADILIAENALTDAYVSGRLSQEDRSLFENRLLINPKQRQRVAFAETFIQYASRQRFDDREAFESTSAWSTIFARVLSGQPLFSYSLAAAAILLFTVSAFWWVSKPGLNSHENVARTQTLATLETDVEPKAVAKSDNDTPLNAATNNTEPTSRSNQPLPRKQPPPREVARTLISTIVLTLGSTRDSEAAKTFVIPEEAGFVKVKMQIENKDFSSYFAVIETIDGQHIWGGKIPRPRENTIAITVPSKRLRRGDYIVSLKGLNKDRSYESIADYSLTIDRR